jgi:hypothetical protein
LVIFKASTRIPLSVAFLTPHLHSQSTSSTQEAAPSETSYCRLVWTQVFHIFLPQQHTRQGWITQTHRPGTRPSGFELNSLKAMASEEQNAAVDQWSAGSALSNIGVLVLNCVIQPSGSMLFAGPSSVWRVSPICCFADTVWTIDCMLYLAIVRRLAITSVCRVIIVYLYVESVNDEKELQEMLQKRRLLALIMGAAGVTQFVKIVAVRGKPLDVAVAYILATVYFSHWLLHEILANTSRLSSRRNLSRDEIHALQYMRATCKSRDHISEFWWFGHYMLCILSLAAIHLAWVAPPWPTAPKQIFFAGLKFLGIVCLLTAFGLGFLVRFVIIRRDSTRLLTVFYACHAVLAAAVIIEYFLIVYDPNQSSRPSWTDWLA